MDGVPLADVFVIAHKYTGFAALEPEPSLLYSVRVALFTVQPDRRFFALLNHIQPRFQLSEDE